MSELYNLIKKVIDEPKRSKAASILYGIDGINLDGTSYYEKIIANFIRKKDSILPKVNGTIEFDLDKDIKEIWDIVFISQYVINYWEKMIKNNDPNKQFYNDCLQKLKKLQIQIKSTASLDLLPQDCLEELKKSIVIFQKIRDSIEHPNENYKVGEELSIENLKGYFKINIPIDYIDGFNKGRIIVKEKDNYLIDKTNNICFPILEKYNFDPKKLESFFYNVDPSQLSYLLDICDNKIERLYKLPINSFYKSKDYNKVFNFILKINNSKILSDDDILFLNKIDFDLVDNYTNNLLYLYYCSKNNSNISIDDVVTLTRIISRSNLNIINRSDDIETYNIILDNYYYVKDLIISSNNNKLKIDELPYDIFTIRNKEIIKNYLTDILYIKEKIFSTDDELSETLNYWFNYFIENSKLLPYVNDVKEIFDNTNSSNKYEYMIDLLLSITTYQNIRMNPRKPWEYFELDDEDKKEITSIINDYKNNHTITRSIKKIDSLKMKKTLSKEKEQIVKIVKEIKERNISFKDYTDELIKESKTNEYYYSGFSKIRWYEDELNYLLLKTNNNYELSVEVISKLSSNIDKKTIMDDNIYYDPSIQELYNNKLKNNFKKNIDLLLSKFDSEKLLEYPSELLYSDEPLFNYLFENYNSNLCKSIFGIDNPKIIGTIVYMNSVLSHYNNTIDANSIDIEPIEIIHSSFNNTVKYSNKMINTQEDYLKQFMINDKDGSKRNEQELKEFIITKLRNSSAHFRFKPVKDENGKIIDDKIYLYDEYNDGVNNFNLVMDINYLVELIRQIEIEIKNEQVTMHSKV